jgi:hypothetical protein
MGIDIVHVRMPASLQKISAIFKKPYQPMDVMCLKHFAIIRSVK